MRRTMFKIAFLEVTFGSDFHLQICKRECSNKYVIKVVFNIRFIYTYSLHIEFSTGVRILQIIAGHKWL